MNAKISAAILFLVSKGVELHVAFDKLLGQGAYSKMVGEIYDELRAK